MKKVILSILSLCASVSLSAQHKIWGWSNGAYESLGYVDSVTFVEPAPVIKYDTLDGYEYVNLGLPSGLLWATCNVGATQPAEYGNYYAWGETAPKEDYSWSTYKLSEGTLTTLTRYNNDNSYGKVDTLTILLPQDDAATVNWGRSWRMPTKAEWLELYHGCSWVYTYDYKNSGIAGVIGTSYVTDAEIFIPAAGRYYGTDLGNAGYMHGYGYYWASDVYKNCTYVAREFSYSNTNTTMNFDYKESVNNGDDRYVGRTVRAVVKK